MTQSSSNEELIVLKKRARRRLVGAVALVLIALIVLWNVLDGEPKSANQQVVAQGVEIVSDSPGLRSRTKPESAVTPLVADEANLSASPVAKSAPRVEVVREPTFADGEENHPATPKPSQPESMFVPKAASPHPSADAVKPAVPIKNSGLFLIQIAALSDESKVKRLQEKLSSAGVKAYTESHGEFTRVRAGPFSSRESAEKALVKVQRLGLTGVIVPK